MVPWNELPERIKNRWRENNKKSIFSAESHYYLHLRQIKDRQNSERLKDAFYFNSKNFSNK